MSDSGTPSGDKYSDPYADDERRSDREEEDRARDGDRDREREGEQGHDDAESADEQHGRGGRSEVDDEHGSPSARRHDDSLHRPAPPAASYGSLPQTPPAAAAASSEEGLSTRRLYVDNLQIPISEPTMRSLFSPFGQIQRLHIVTDIVTGRQKGFIFVEYVGEKEGEQAMQALNGYSLGGKSMRVHVAKSKKTAQPSGQQSNQMQYAPSNSSGSGSLLGGPPSAPRETPPGDTIHIVGVPFHWTEPEIRELFNPCGPIRSVRILMDRTTNRSKGAGFVQFDTLPQAAAAIQMWHGKKPPGSDIYLQVRYAYAKREDGAQSNGGQQSQSYEPLSLQSAPIMPSITPNFPNPNSNDSGYGPDRKGRSHTAGQRFDPLAKPKALLGSASNAVAAASSTSAAGTGASDACLFIYFVPSHMTSDELRNLFSAYGTVTHVNIPRNNANGETRGFGFCTMSTKEEAQWAMDRMQGYEVGGKRLKISFKKEGSGSGGREGGDQKQSSSQQASQSSSNQFMLPMSGMMGAQGMLANPMMAGAGWPMQQAAAMMNPAMNAAAAPAGMVPVPGMPGMFMMAPQVPSASAAQPGFQVYGAATPAQQASMSAMQMQSAAMGAAAAAMQPWGMGMAGMAGMGQGGAAGMGAQWGMSPGMGMGMGMGMQNPAMGAMGAQQGWASQQGWGQQGWGM
jgi:RNA recognition motif-containing protein